MSLVPLFLTLALLPAGNSLLSSDDDMDQEQDQDQDLLGINDFAGVMDLERGLPEDVDPVFEEVLVDGDEYTDDTLERCPRWQTTMAERDAVEERMSRGPVLTKTKTHRAATKPLHLFIIASPFSGSTALLSMLATSPEATTLCSGKTWACEGTWLLIKRKEALYHNRWWPNASQVGPALHIFQDYWDPSKPVRLEKSPPNIVKVPDIAQFFAKKRRQVGFIFLTRAACNNNDPSGEGRNFTRALRQAVDTVKEGFKSLVLHYEDLIRDPYGTAQKIVDKFPALRQLDPAENPLYFSGKTRRQNNKRTQSVAEYVVERGPFANELWSAPRGWLKLDRTFGYP